MVTASRARARSAVSVSPMSQATYQQVDARDMNVAASIPFLRHMKLMPRYDIVMMSLPSPRFIDACCRFSSPIRCSDIYSGPSPLSFFPYRLPPIFFPLLLPLTSSMKPSFFCFLYLCHFFMPIFLHDILFLA